jgi:hypothetical protein
MVKQSEEPRSKLPRGYKLFKLMGEYYVVDSQGVPYACSPDKGQAIRNAVLGVRPCTQVPLSR